ncbi:MAG: serine/threonine protein kinase [Oscillospiraceae bacterium]|nr:serine/threonine protein kinase [Oscillospiraceae bacterium]
MNDLYVQWIDNIPFKLKNPFDTEFIHKYGTVFKVFDGQDSGNLCFGVKDGDKRYFVKFAGAPTEQYNGKIEDAILCLKSIVPVYRDLEHPNLIHFVKAEEIGGGFAAIFDWVDAECMGKQYPLSHKKFMQMPLEKKMGIFEDIVMFHIHVARSGYVAIDFYDGSIMYDFENDKTVICDIDFYQKVPYYGDMGLWGSKRFISPEEHTDGAVIDEVTNVYTMGATAFALFSDSNRNQEVWPLKKSLFDVVKKAVSDDRSKRQQSIQQFLEEWRNARL